ncbi:hypothetical protein L2E82_20619 [Cichorium intybus]|uniref:Uncharacterized protein n=1 Tax=Cichorium intybus TaxID=13427 RepID=A0ACB9DU91_CICIN|nr:hypothetical protein L2E82_20619 [Cichorium intybus]
MTSIGTMCKDLSCAKDKSRSTNPSSYSSSNSSNFHFFPAPHDLDIFPPFDIIMNHERAAPGGDCGRGGHGGEMDLDIENEEDQKKM